MEIHKTPSYLSPHHLKSLFEHIEYRVARTREELEKAFTLVYREYLKRGYITKESGTPFKISIYNALPDTTTFVAIAGNEILATATVIPDSPLGLPMDELYNEELKPFREKNKKICEISMLASNTDLFEGGISLMLNAKKMFLIFNLFKLIFDYARNVLKLDMMCITINPKHKLTYDFLLFKDLGGLKTYKSVNDAPAIAKYLDLHTVEEECRKENKTGLYKMFFSRTISGEQLSNKARLTPDDLKYFFMNKTKIFLHSSPQQLEYIKKCYPQYNFDEIIS